MIHVFDEWDVDSDVIDGLVFHVRVAHDPYPSVYGYGDEEAYDAEAREAWKRDEWWFVDVEVTPEYRGVVVDEASSAIGGTQWGEYPGVSIGRDYFENVHPLPDYLIPEVVEQLRDHVHRGAIRQTVRAARRRARQTVLSARRNARCLRRLRKQLAPAPPSRARRERLQAAEGLPPSAGPISRPGTFSPPQSRRPRSGQGSSSSAEPVGGTSMTRLPRSTKLARSIIAASRLPSPPALSTPRSASRSPVAPP